MEQLFRRCDTTGTGYIDKDEFRDLCAGFDIGSDDADVIFADLDHDGDGRISFEDFSFGFRDFLTPGSKRGSVQLGLMSPKGQVSRQPSFKFKEFERMDSLQEVEAKQKEMEKKHRVAKQAWQHLADNLGKDDVKKFLNVSGDKIFTLYEELQTSEVPPHLLDHFEALISALVVDVKNIDQNNKLMEERFARERESHNAYLKSIEAELDAQMARVEQQAKEKAKQEHDHEKRELQQKMDAELAELQTQLKLFQKVDTWLNKEKDENNHSKETQRRLVNAVDENRSLKMSLNGTQTNIALLRSELGQIRSQYENKCSELSEERENKMEYMYEMENINRQLELLREANQKLQDTNDGLRQVVDVNTLRSPRLSRGRLSDVSGLADQLDNEPYRRKRTRRGGPVGSGPTSENGGSFYDSDSMRSRGSRGSERMKLPDTQFGIKRLLEDLDSGHSTLPAEDDLKDQRSYSPELDDDAASAIRVLESVVIQHDDDLQPNGGSKSLEQKDRDLTEVKGQPQVSSRVIDVSDHIKDRAKPTPAPRKTSVGLVRRPSAAARSRDKQLPVALMDLEATGPPDRTYKVVFAGDAAVGKTSFINRITKGLFMANLSSTLGVDFQVKTIRVDERNIALQLWDTAGQERFRSVTRSYFRRADGVMLLYDVTNERSFLAVRQWIDAVDDVAEKRIPIMLCGNKTDLRQTLVSQGRKCISTEQGERLARDHSATFLETSSKEGNNVIDALVQLSRDMCSSEDAEVQTSVLKIHEDQPIKKSCCRK